MNNETKIGVILGLNISAEMLFKKLCKDMSAECLLKHELLPNLSDDIDLITELIEKQRTYIEEVGYDPICKAGLQIGVD